MKRKKQNKVTGIFESLKKKYPNIKVLHLRKFNEVKKDGKIVQELQQNGGITALVIEHDDFYEVHTARCNEKDQYNRRLGIRIAHKSICLNKAVLPTMVTISEKIRDDSYTAIYPLINTSYLINISNEKEAIKDEKAMLSKYPISFLVSKAVLNKSKNNTTENENNKKSNQFRNLCTIIKEFFVSYRITSDTFKSFNTNLDGYCMDPKSKFQRHPLSFYYERFHWVNCPFGKKVITMLLETAMNTKLQS